MHHLSYKYIPRILDTVRALLCFAVSNGSPDSKVQGANMGPTWALSVPDGPHVSLINLAIWVGFAYTFFSTLVTIRLHSGSDEYYYIDHVKPQSADHVIKHTTEQNQACVYFIVFVHLTEIP